MNMRLVPPAIAALTLLAAAPASAQTHSRHSAYALQGGGGAGPYTLQSRRFANFNQRERCTQLTMERYYWRLHRQYYD